MELNNSFHNVNTVSVKKYISEKPHYCTVYLTLKKII